MEIGREIQNLINNYIQGNTKNSVNEVKPLLKSVKTGEELRVQLLKIMSNTSLVELDDGSEMVISGRLPKEADVGMILNIKVKSKSEGVPILAEIVSVENPENSKMDEIKKDFKNLKIPMTKENLEVTREMIKGNVEINEKNIDTTFKMLSEFKHVGAKNLIFMLKNDINITKASTDSFLGMINRNDFIETNLNNIIKVLSDEIAKIEITNGKIEIAVNDVGTLKENDSSDGMDTKVQDEVDIEKDVSNVDKKNENGEIKENFEIPNSVEGKKQVVNNEEIKNIVKINEYLDVSEMIIPANDDEIIRNEAEINEQNTFQDKKENIVIKDECNNKIFESDKDSFFKEEKLKVIRSKVEDIFKSIEKNENFSSKIKGKKMITELMKEVNELEEEIEKLPEDLKTNISKETSRVKQNVELLNDLNKYNTILQIPLNVNNARTMAELYIFNGDKESSNRKINENNYTMFLSLGTANIGQIEAYVKVVNKTVECNFMTASSDAIFWLKEDTNELMNLLDTYGYQLIKMDVKEYNEKRMNIFEAIEKNKMEENKFKFDMKV